MHGRRAALLPVGLLFLPVAPLAAAAASLPDIDRVRRIASGQASLDMLPPGAKAILERVGPDLEATLTAAARRVVPRTYSNTN